MLGVLVELLVSTAICGALAYVFLLYAPAEELCPGPAAGTAGSYDPYSAHAPHTLEEGMPWWAPLLPWERSSPLYGVYHHIVVERLGLSEAAMAPPRSATASAAGVAMGVSGRRGRHARAAGLSGGTGGAPAHPLPSPLRRESAHWLLALSRWLGVLVLGGGTASPEVWTDRLRGAAVRAVAKANATWDRAMHTRVGVAAAARGATEEGPPLLQLLHLEFGAGLARESGGGPRASPTPGGEAWGEGELTAWAAAGSEAVHSSSLTAPTAGWGSDEVGGHSPSLPAHPPPAPHGPTAGAVLGTVLPRLAGDVVSVEIPFYSPPVGAASPLPSPHAAEGGDRGSPTLRARSSSAAAAVPSPPPPRPLRCFCVPLHYEDGRFVLRLGCCLPLGALLPAAVPLPADVLSLQCAVTVRHLRIHGALHVAFHGPRLELTFPTAPQFTMALTVTPSAQYKGRGAPPGPSLATSAFATTWTGRSAVGGGGAALPPQQTQGLPSYGHPHPHPHPQQQQAPSRPTPAAQRSEKVQELVLLAVQRALASITYPNVLEGRVNFSSGGPHGLEASTSLGSDAEGDAKAAPQGLLTWTRKAATLPLYT